MAAAALQAWRMRELLSETSTGPAPGHNLSTLSNATSGACTSTTPCAAAGVTPDVVPTVISYGISHVMSMG